MYIDLNLLTKIDLTYLILEYWLLYYVLRIMSLGDSVVLSSGYRVMLASHCILFVLHLQSFLLRVSASIHHYCAWFLESILYMSSLIWSDTNWSVLDSTYVFYSFCSIADSSTHYIGTSFWSSITFTEGFCIVY